MDKENQTIATITQQDLANKDSDSVRNLIHFFHGKPDSDYEIFDDKILVTLEHLIALNDQVGSKIENHTSQNLCKVTVVLSENKIREFSSWQQFKEFDWRIHYLVKSISITWDFFIKLPEFVALQRHSLNVKIVSGERGDEFLHAILHDPEKYEERRNKQGTILARVDFINHRLGQELLNIVKDWNKSLPKNNTLNDKFTEILYHAEFAYSYPAMMGGMLIYLYFVSTYIIHFQTENVVLTTSAIILTGSIVLRFSREIGDWLYYNSLKLLRRCKLPRISITSGDDQEYKKKQKKQNKGIITALFNFGGSLVANALGAVLLKYF